MTQKADRSVDAIPEPTPKPAPESTPKLTDEALVDRLKAGDERAAEALVRRHQEKAYAIALTMSDGDREEAWDMTQNAFLKAFRKLDSFQGNSAFYTWFYRILVNTCLDGRRKRIRRERRFLPWRWGRADRSDETSSADEPPDTVDASNPMEMLAGKELAEEVKRAVASLSEKQRTAFQLKVLHGMTIREIAAVMGAAEGTVKSHLFRATRFMRETLADWVEREEEDT